MGTDTPLAVLSDRAQPLFNYFKQLFAQVTNPPLDAIREELVTSVFTGAGGEGNLLEPRPESCRQIALGHADPRQRRAGADQAARRLARLQGASRCPCCSGPPTGPTGLETRTRRRSFEQACAAIEQGANLIVLSDRGVTRRDGADPLAAGVLGLAPRDGPQGAAVARRVDHRMWRCARSSSLRPAPGVWRRHGQPVRGLRDARRHDPAGDASRASTTTRRSIAMARRSRRGSSR